MNFAEGHIYHVYNRGNNSQAIFHTHENYSFFLNKMYEYILPYADILAWCLMPNHFHWLISLNKLEITFIEQVTQSHLLNKKRSLNDSISILLRSYTRAIQKQEGMTGSLFQNRTKALCLTEPQGVSPSYFNTSFGMMANLDLPETNYLNVCFDYIHMNPLNGKLVSEAKDWEYSSYRDYFCGRKGRLINRELARELGLIS